MEINSPAALNNFNKLSTGLYRQLSKIGTVSFSCHVMKKWQIFVNCYKWLHKAPLIYLMNLLRSTWKFSIMLAPSVRLGILAGKRLSLICDGFPWIAWLSAHFRENTGVYLCPWKSCSWIERLDCWVKSKCMTHIYEQAMIHICLLLCLFCPDYDLTPS